MYKGQSIDVAVCHIVFIIKSQLTHQFMHKHFNTSLICEVYCLNSTMLDSVP